jgi:hypothetical protein
VIEIPPHGSFAEQADLLSVQLGDVRIAILEAIEDAGIPSLLTEFALTAERFQRAYRKLFPWPRRSIKKWHKS